MIKTADRQRVRIRKINRHNHPLTLEAHQQLGRLLEDTWLYNIFKFDEYSTMIAQRNSREYRILLAIDLLKALLDEQVRQQHSTINSASPAIYYGWDKFEPPPQPNQPPKGV